ncbi:MAG: type II toxin-antitoxin system VapC family toxin [Shinella sp.]|nr:type II toxin-antitoxin system VapC family toxin [Shinella sp.]
MVVDTSALAAILFDEPERERFSAVIGAAPDCLISAATVLELKIVLFNRQGPDTVAKVDSLLLQGEIRIEPVTADTAELAFLAFRRFGKGSGHPAGLNYGDCFSYALAREKSARLLFKGDDFIHTDIEAAI